MRTFSKGGNLYLMGPLSVCFHVQTCSSFLSSPFHSLPLPPRPSESKRHLPSIREEQRFGNQTLWRSNKSWLQNLLSQRPQKNSFTSHAGDGETEANKHHPSGRAVGRSGSSLRPGNQERAWHIPSAKYQL